MKNFGKSLFMLEKGKTVSSPVKKMKLVYKDKEIWTSVEKNLETPATLQESPPSLLVEKILELTQEGDLILELGCGAAKESSYLALQGRETVGLDISSHALRVAKKVTSIYNANVQLVQGDVKALPFKDETFDFIFSTLVMCYFQDLKPLLEEQRRILKSGKYLALYVPYRYSLFTIEKHLYMLSGKWPWGWETEFSLRELKRLLKRHKFAVVATWKNPSLDRYLRILLNFHQTRYGKKLPKRISILYQVLTKPFRWIALKCCPTSVVIIGRKER